MSPAEKATNRRLRRHVRKYAEAWGVEKPRVTAEDVFVIAVRADGYSNAHVQGEHEAHGCVFNARDCGERAAAEEFVEAAE